MQQPRKTTTNPTPGGFCGWLGLLLLAGIASADPNLRSRNLIIGGWSAPAKRYPYYVALKDINSEIQCGGTLIAPDVVLTAAHCRSSTLMYADVGRYSTVEEEGFGETIAILNPLEMATSGWTTVTNLEKSDAAIIHETGFLHPKHDLDKKTYDIMLIKLARPASRGQPIVKVNQDPEFPVKQPGGKNEITIIGMGTTNVDAVWFNEAITLKHVHVDFFPYEECVDIESYQLDYKHQVRPDMICTMGAGIYGDRGQCYGDSGGPYIATGDSHEEDVQVGVVSWAVNCANSVFPMVGARTSHSLDFLKEITCSISAYPPAYLCAEENNAAAAAASLQNRFIPDGVTVSVRVYSDPYGHELKWRITDESDDNNVYAKIPYGRIDGDHLFQDVVVPAGGRLKFKIDDAADDGIFGDADSILYEVVLVDTVGELVMVEGNGQFGSSREESFQVPQMTSEYLAQFRASRESSSKTNHIAVTGPTAKVKIFIKFHEYHEDAAWKITSADGLKTFASKNAGSYRFGTDVTEEVDLPAGDYKFTISDRRGTDTFRAFTYYKLSYDNIQQQQQITVGGQQSETIIYESEEIFEGEEKTHEFNIPVSATSGPAASTPQSSPEVVIDEAAFTTEGAQIASCTAEGELCSSVGECCKGLCRRGICSESRGSAASAASSRVRMRTSIRGDAGGSSRGN